MWAAGLSEFRFSGFFARGLRFGLLGLRVLQAEGSLEYRG